jgi:hypothetical protein
MLNETTFIMQIDSSWKKYKKKRNVLAAVKQFVRLCSHFLFWSLRQLCHNRKLHHGYNIQAIKIFTLSPGSRLHDPYPSHKAVIECFTVTVNINLFWCFNLLVNIIMKVNKIVTSKYLSRPVNFVNLPVILTSEKKIISKTLYTPRSSINTKNLATALYV